MTFSQIGCHFSNVFRMIWERLKAFCAWERHWLDFFLGLFYIGILFWGQKRSWVVFLRMVFKTFSSNVLGQRWQMILMFFQKNHVFSADLPLKSTRLIHATVRLRNSSKSWEHGGPAGSCPTKLGIFQKGIQKKEPPSHVVLCFFPHVWGWFTVRFLLKKGSTSHEFGWTKTDLPPLPHIPWLVVARIISIWDDGPHWQTYSSKPPFSPSFHWSIGDQTWLAGKSAI